MSPTLTEFLRRQAATYASFVAVSTAAIALSQYTGRGEPLQTPGQLALAVSLILSGSLAVVLAERCLDQFLTTRADDSRVAALFLAVGTATLTVAILVFYAAVYT